MARTQSTAALTRTDGPRRKRGRHPIPLLRQRIIRSAVELFGEKGFEAVLTDEVAARAGVGKGSVYRQFRSKEELYAEAVIDGFIELRGKIEKALGEARSERERVTTVVTEILSFFWDRGEFFVLLRDPTRLPPAQSTRFRKERLRLSAVVGRVLAGESAAGRLRGDLDFELATEALFGMIRGVRRNRHPSTTLSEASATVVAIFLDGFQRNAACSRRPTTRTAH